MKKLVLNGAIGVLLVVVSATAEARRDNDTEIMFMTPEGYVIGSVLYGCEGGQYFDWADGVVRTDAESRALAETTTKILGYKMTCPTFEPHSWHCVSDVWAPKTWEDAVSECNWYSTDDW